MHVIRRIAFLSTCLLAATANAQSSDNSLHLVLLDGTGGVTVPLHGEWKASGLKLYDQGTRPSIEMTGKQPGLELSILLFKNLSGAPTAESCRGDVIRPLLKRFSDMIDKKSITQSELTTNTGARLAVESYTLAPTSSEIAAIAGTDLIQRNTFAFYGDANICAELHISQMMSKKSPPMAFEPDLKNFQPDGAYVASMSDFMQMGAIYYQVTKDYAAAGRYYQHALDLLPSPQQPQQLNIFRYLNDQTSMAYGISGNLRESRAINEAAIAKDPDYPLYYYDLACADAESGDATAAQAHLQQAFDRRKNTLEGEHIPDPTKDDSILKLKRNKAFWEFVQGLPKE